MIKLQLPVDKIYSKVISEEITHGLVVVFNVKDHKSDYDAVYNFVRLLNFIPSDVPMVVSLFQKRIDLMIQELSDPNNYYQFDMLGYVMLYHSTIQTADMCSVMKYKWEPYVEQELLNSLKEKLIIDLPFLFDRIPKNDKTLELVTNPLSNRYYKCLEFSLTRFPEYNSEFGIGRYPYVFGEPFIYPSKREIKEVEKELENQLGSYTDLSFIYTDNPAENCTCIHSQIFKQV